MRRASKRTDLPHCADLLRQDFSFLKPLKRIRTTLMVSSEQNARQTRLIELFNSAPIVQNFGMRLRHRRISHPFARTRGKGGFKGVREDPPLREKDRRGRDGCEGARGPIDRRRLGDLYRDLRSFSVKDLTFFKSFLTKISCENEISSFLFYFHSLLILIPKQKNFCPQEKLKYGICTSIKHSKAISLWILLFTTVNKKLIKNFPQEFRAIKIFHHFPYCGFSIFLV